VPGIVPSIVFATVLLISGIISAVDEVFVSTEEETGVAGVVTSPSTRGEGVSFSLGEVGDISKSFSLTFSLLAAIQASTAAGVTKIH
jgi:hypothetical protein